MICSKCGRDLDVICYANRGNGKLHKQCRECKRIATNNHYANNKAVYIQRAKASNIKIKERIACVIRSAKDKPCADCGRSYPSYVMDFDHISPDTKLYNVGDMPRRCSVRLVQEEIEKCEVVCANCHRIRTHEKIPEKNEKRT